LPNKERRNPEASGHIIDAQSGLNHQIVEGDELVSRMHSHSNDIFGETGFSSGSWVNDVTRNGERLGNLLLFGQTLQSSKASASGNHFATVTSIGPLNCRKESTQLMERPSSRGASSK
jgi:hypothetical protein